MRSTQEELGEGLEKITIVQWNVEGATRALSLLPPSAFVDIDVIILTETWETKPLELPGFYAAHSLALLPSGRGRPSGGVSILFNQKLGGVSIMHAEDDVIVLWGSRCSIIAAYVRPPSIENTTVLIDKITRAMHALPSLAPPLILGGDLNTRIDKPDDQRTRTLLALLNDFGCRVLSDANTPTFEGFMGRSVIDIFASNVRFERARYIGSTNPLSEGSALRWHVPVGVELFLEHERTPPERNVSLPKTLDPTKLGPKLMALFPVPREPDIDSYAATLTEVLKSSVAEARPRRQRPWFNTSCKLASTALRYTRELTKRYPAMRPMFTLVRSWYRRVLESARQQHIAQQEDRLVEQAGREPHKWLRRDRPTACPISSSVLIDYFRGMYAAANTIPSTVPSYASVWDEQATMMREDLAADFSVFEVLFSLEHLQSNKAAGPDRIRNEHLRSAADMFPCWTSLFNACLRHGRLPASWGDALLCVIPKGKGNPHDPSSWRAIAKKSCCYKLLAHLITRRLTRFLEGCSCIPPEQHGFRSGHSTITACETLLQEVHQVISKPKQALFAVFVDFKSAFDTAPRDTILMKLAQSGVPVNMLHLIRSILQENSVSIDDGVAQLEPFSQSTGVAQGDNLSPLLFSLLLSDLPRRVQDQTGHVKTLLYADDLVIYGRSRFHVQQALARLSAYVKEIGLLINMNKTEAMKFRRGGRLAATDTLRIDGTNLKYVKSFKYLGVVMPTNGQSFVEHITDRGRRAMVASVGIRTPARLSLRTALALFDIKVAPVASYGIQVIWKHLSSLQLEKLDRIKPAFLKRALGLHRSALNRYVYLLSDTPLFAEDLKRRFNLPCTPAYLDFISAWETKMAEIDPNFYRTGALVTETWKLAGRTNRHVLTRFAVHGFHHVLCGTGGFHSPSDTCICMRCGEMCVKYHATECSAVQSLGSLSERAV